MYQKKCKKFWALFLAGCMVTGCVFTGCGNENNGSSGSTKVSSMEENINWGSSSGADSNGGTGSSSADSNGESGSSSGDSNETSGEGTEETPSEAPEVTEKPELYIQKSKFKKDKQIYSDGVRNIKTLGLMEYKKFENKGYTDKPAKGKVYVVLFLDVTNASEEPLYFHPSYLLAKVDGKKVENTFLYHDPEDYKTIFKNINAGDHEQGFIVWEVPKNWKKMVVTFKQFELMGGNRLVLSFKKKDLKAPDAPSKMEN